VAQGIRAEIYNRCRRLLLLPALILAAVQFLPLTPATGADPYAQARQKMLVDIRANAAGLGKGLAEGPIPESVLQVMAAVPRHLFVPETLRGAAYDDRPLPIGHGQTISQPFIVAYMTALTAAKPGDTVLEVGTGSGYQAAVLAKLGTRVFTIEIIPELASAATARLPDSGFPDVQVRSGDGYYGWPEAAPFDAIVVTAAASHIPPPLLQQLRPGGRMVIPVGGPFAVQQLVLVEKSDDGSLRSRHLLPVRFVPLTGGP
jgi:protein-L-isoaspartate(D-aspartate) O-methyltransferase